MRDLPNPGESSGFGFGVDPKRNRIHGQWTEVREDGQHAFLAVPLILDKLFVLSFLSGYSSSPCLDF